MPHLTLRLLAAILLFASFTATAQQTPYTRWMADNWDTVKDKPIRELVIPGSHDAGTKDLGRSLFSEIEHKALPDDSPLKNCRILGYDAAICVKYAQNQASSIYFQLQLGSRFLDLRFARTFEVENTLLGTNPLERFGYRIHHSFVGATKEEIFNDIRRYLAEPGHEKEIILLEFNQMVGWDEAKPKTNSFTEDENREFLSEFAVRFQTPSGERSLADFMVPTSIEVPVAGTVDETKTVHFENMTPQQIVGGYQVGNRVVPPTGKQLIVYYPDKNSAPAEKEIFGAPPSKLWNKNPGDWMGSIHVRECKYDGGVVRRIPTDTSFKSYSYSGCDALFYPEPSRWQSEDAIANDWIFRLPGRTFERKSLTPSEDKYAACTSCERGHVSNISFGGDKEMEMLTNTVILDPDVIGWASLKEAAAFYNPRAIPQLINRARRDLNVISTDYFASSGLTKAAIMLNKDPARVTLNIKSIQKMDGSCNQNAESGDTLCDFYPVFTVNNDESEAPEATIIGPQHQRGRVIDDNNFVIRGAFWREPFWMYTIAVPWDQPLQYDIAIYDDDPSPISDELLTIVNTASSSSPISAAASIGDVLQGQDGCYPDIVWEFDDVRVVYDLFIEHWDSPNGGCGPSWNGVDVTVGTATGQRYAENVFFVDEPFTPRTGISFVDVLTCDKSTETCAPKRKSVCNVVAPTPTGDSLGAVRSGENRFHLGETSVRCEARMTDGTRSATAFTVTVIDDQPPEIYLPVAVPSYEADGELTVIDIGMATANDAIDSDLDISNNAPASYPLGVTIVTWTATDAAGNTATADQTITVVDSQPPVLDVPTDIAGFEATGGQTVVEIGTATASDAVDSQIDVTSNAPLFFSMGQTIVIWTATDASGNTTTANQSVTVVDTTAPVVTAPGPKNVTAGVEGQSIGTATATDVVGVALISKEAPNMFSVGATTVTWYAIDKAGNIGEATQVVTGEKSGGGSISLLTLLSLLLLVLVYRHRELAVRAKNA